MTQKRWWLLAGVLALAFGTNVRGAEDQPASPGQVQLDVVVAKVRPDLLPLPDRDNRTRADGFRVLSPEERERVLGALQALRSAKLARVCAEPKLVTLSGRTASFLSGGEVAVPIRQVGQAGVQFEEFGLRLNLLPTLVGGDRLRLELESEVSEITPASGIFQAARCSQRVHGTAELRPGQAMVCCGLKQSAKLEAKEAADKGAEKTSSGEWEQVVLVTPVWRPREASSAASGKTASWSPAKSESAEPQILMNVLVAEVKLPPGTVLPGCKPAPVEPGSRLRPYFIGRFSPEEQSCVVKLLRALREEDRCEILTMPQVITLNGQQAQVTIGGDKERISLNLLPVLKKDKVLLHCQLERTVPGCAIDLGNGIAAPGWSTSIFQTRADVKDSQMMLVHGWHSPRNHTETKAGPDGKWTLVLMVKPQVGVVPDETGFDWHRYLATPAEAVPLPAPVAPRPLPPPVPIPAPPAVMPNPIPQPAPVPQTGCRVRVVTEEGEARLEVQDRDICLTCTEVRLKRPDGSRLRLSVGDKQVQVETATFQAMADHLMRMATDKLVLEGNVRMFRHAPDKTMTEVRGHKVIIGPGHKPSFEVIGVGTSPK
jgi:hypothetical protein